MIPVTCAVGQGVYIYIYIAHPTSICHMSHNYTPDNVLRHHMFIVNAVRRKNSVNEKS
jgi:hypothetical protein